MLANIALGENKPNINLAKPVAQTTMVFPKDATVQFTSSATRLTDQVPLTDRATGNVETGRNERQRDNGANEDTGAS